MGKEQYPVLKIKGLKLSFEEKRESKDGMAGLISLGTRFTLVSGLNQALREAIQTYLAAGLKDQDPTIEEVVFDE